MSTKSSLIAIPGSHRATVKDAQLLKPSDPGQKIKISIYARANPKPPAALVARAAAMNTQLPGERKYFTPEEYNQLYGADPADLANISKWASGKNLTILKTDPAQKKVEVEGTVADINDAFGVQLNEYEHPEYGQFRGRTGKVSVPHDLFGVIEGVFGLDNRPLGRPNIRKTNLASMPFPAAGKVTNPFPGTFFPPEVAALYNYPPGTDGSGQNIAVFAFNGGSQGDPRGGYSLPALQNYYRNVLGMTTMPTIQDVVITGPGNDPGPETDASGQNGDSTDEIMLDTCIVGSVAPGAKMFVYFTEFTSKGWVNALTDAIAGNNGIGVISISYGNPETGSGTAWTPMAISVVNKALQSAMTKGITICVSSGDSGSFADGGSSVIEVDFPASSPFVLTVGGTNLVASGASISSETVWNGISQGGGATGGGISVVFSKPDYQDGADIPVSAAAPHKVGRGLPDVSAVGDPNTGVVVIHIDGKKLDGAGGTSASAPLWASLIARLNQKLNAKCGFLNPLLYTKFSSGVLRDITKGNNGAYQAKPGWDACTGFGSPDGGKLLSALSGSGSSAKSNAKTSGAAKSNIKGASSAKSKIKPGKKVGTGKKKNR